MPRRRPAKPASALDARQRKLHEEAEKLRQKQEHLNRFITEAPQKVAKIKEAQQRELRSRARDSVERRSSRALPDKRFDVSLAGMMPAPRPRRALKSQRRQTQLITLALLVVLAVLVLLVINGWHQ